MSKVRKKSELVQWMDAYGPLIYSICKKIVGNHFDAQDLVQETFLSAFRSMDSFKGEEARNWLCKIATNKSLDFIKSAGRRILPTEEGYFQEIPGKTLSPEEEAIEKDQYQKVTRFCEGLKEPYHSVAINYFCKEMTVKEISQETGKNQKTVQTQVARSKELLRKVWRKEENYGEL